jgi:hypothetical protein
VTIPDKEKERIHELLGEYHRLAHAMQSGVKWEQEHGVDDGSPKHMRVGINNAMRDHGSLAALLIRKGIISDLEYAEAIVVGMREEVAMYERRISEKTGREVHLV